MKKSETAYKVEEPQVLNPPEPLAAGDGPYRPNVAALVIRREGDRFHICLGERSDSHGFWQWPQGGMEPGEEQLETLARELAEEIGLTRYRVRYRFPFRLRYRFPQSYVDRCKRKHIGQEQTYFIVEAMDEPDLDRAGEDEFRDINWFPVERAADWAIWFKAPLYRRVLDHALGVLARD